MLPGMSRRNRHRGPKPRSPRCLILGGPLDGRYINRRDNPESTTICGHLYLKHTAVHPKNRSLRQAFYFHAGSMTHSSPALLDAVVTWMTGISPMSRGGHKPPKKPKRRSGMAPTPRDTADHAGEDRPRQNHGGGKTGNHRPDSLAEMPGSSPSRGHHTHQPTVTGQTSPPGVGPLGHQG